MSLARMIVDGWSWMITRRCVEQQFLMRPDRAGVVANTYRYCMAHAAEETGVQVHAYVAMSNHSHVVQADPTGEQPGFAGRFHGLFARIMNVRLGRKASFFDGSCSYNGLHCVDPDDVLTAMAYVTTNPVAAGLVERPEDWPGAITLPEHFLEDAPPIVATRPTDLLRSKGRSEKQTRDARARARAHAHRKPKDPLPERVVVKLVIPAAYRHLGRERFVALYRDRVNARLEQLKDERERQADPKKRRVLGVEAIFRTPVNDAPKPKTAEQLAAEKQRRHDDGLVPHVACRDPVRRREHKLMLCAFWRENRRCYEAFREGERDVVFPAGTWGMARFQGVRVADAG